MRSLLATGWLHFRGRAMLVAFASYHLWLHWRPLALHLAQCFVDYEPGIHYPQIQMQAGTTGINPNRMYNPVKQSQQKDTDGAFIRQWLPELRQVPTSWLHSPWLMPITLQQRYGCVIGQHYPAPIVDLQHAQQQARAKLSQWLQQHDRLNWQQQKQAVVERHASRKRPAPHQTLPAKDQLSFDW
ncbi:FAD-binding domain-containing protein [Rheinheimera sp.]